MSDSAKKIAYIVVSIMLFLTAIIRLYLIFSTEADEQSAIKEFAGIWSSEIFVLLSSLFIIHLALISAIAHLFIAFDKSDISISAINNIITLFTLGLLGYGLLKTLNSEQFSLLATFIGLPFVTIIPKLSSECFNLSRNFFKSTDVDKDDTNVGD